MTWSSVDWTATEAVVGRIQDRIFRAAKIKRPRLEPDDEQSSCPVLRGLGSGNEARLPDAGKMHEYFPETSKTGGETTASPKIWENQDDFRAKFDAWAKDIEKAKAETKDLDTFKAN